MGAAIPAVASAAAQGLVIGGIPFVETPAGLIAQTPLTFGQHKGIMEMALPHPEGPYTLRNHPGAVVSMHRHTGNAVVMSRGPLTNVADRIMSPVAIAGEEISYGAGQPATVTRGVVVDLTPTSRVYADPNFADRPMTEISWLQGVAIAAALTEMDVNYVVRLITEAEYGRIVLCDGEMTEAEVIEMAHLYREGVTGTASVVGNAAQRRTNKWGIVDAFGNVWIVTNDPHDLSDVTSGKPITEVTRVSRGASWLGRPQDSRVAGRVRFGPVDVLDGFGVRFVAVRRAPR